MTARCLTLPMAALAASLLTLHPPALAAVADTFNPADYVAPQCPKFFTLDAASFVCRPNNGDIKAIADADTCLQARLKFDAAEKICKPPDTAPAPVCKTVSGYLGRVSGTGAAAACLYERVTTSSAPGDYIGDCIGVKMPPPGTALQADSTYFVSAQRNLENDDRELTLVDGEMWMLPRLKQLVPTMGCQARAGGTVQLHVLASQLVEAGANRRGWAYGALVMPYKYFPSDKSFLTGTPVGGYMGWRFGQAGSGTTLAWALTLSSVEANTVDPNTLDGNGQPTVTGKTNVSALSGALGFVFDILKSPQGRPFKAGVFIGKDVIDADPTVVYRFNRKKWFALQLGFDFTDQ